MNIKQLRNLLLDFDQDLEILVAKAAVDPLIEELPPVQESKPTSADDVEFEIEISPYVVGGKTYFRWEIIGHTYSSYIGDYVGHRDSGYDEPKDAETGAAEYVARIRHAVDLKLNVPDSYRYVL
jgi:hypothetical protein